MPRIRIVGLGPAGLDRLSDSTRAALEDASQQVVVRTLEHPAAAELAATREVISCDDLYEAGGDFSEVYAAIVDRVTDLAERGPVVYAVPGNPRVGERAVSMLAETANVEIERAESFIDLALAAVGLDPLDRGFQVLDAHVLPEPLLLHLPTLISQVDSPGTLFGVRDGLLGLLPGVTLIHVLSDLGDPAERVEELPIADLRPEHAGMRVTLYIDVPTPGWPGLVATNARLRLECPWDREQTHHSLARHLLEEAHEALEAIERLPAEAPGGEADLPAYVELEEELGDLLLQVVFHATLASEAGVFGVEEVAEGVRRKLVARHPHVFGDVDAETAEHVLANWERLKRDEKGRDSLMDGVPRSLPALARARTLQGRAAGVGFDWSNIHDVADKVREELAEALAEGADPLHEIGDLLFSVVNLARHLDVDPEQALRTAVDRFDRRFRSIEDAGDVAQMSLEDMDAAWEDAKREEGAG